MAVAVFVAEEPGRAVLVPDREEPVIAAHADDPAAAEAPQDLRVGAAVLECLARERQVFALYAESLAALIAEETNSAPNDIAPRAVANALLGVHRALIDYVRERALAGAPASQIARQVRIQAKRAFAQLERGLGDYGAEKA